MTQALMSYRFLDGSWAIYDNSYYCPSRPTALESFLVGVSELLLGEFGYSSEVLPLEEVSAALIAGEDSRWESGDAVVRTYGTNNITLNSTGMSFDITMRIPE